MAMIRTSEVLQLATVRTPAATPSKRTAKGVSTRKSKKNVDSTTTKRRRKKVQPTIDASLKWQPEQSIFEVVPEHDWDNFMELTRKAWMETPDQGIDAGDYRSRVACKKLMSLAIFPWTDPRGVVTTVVREQVSASGESSSTLDSSDVARRVELAVDKAMASDPKREQPPKDLVMFRMAQKMLQPHPHKNRRKGMTQLAGHQNSKGGHSNKNKAKFSKAYYEALDGLWRRDDTWPAVQAEYDARSQEVEGTMESIADIWNPRKATKRSQYEQFDRDEVAAADPSILIRIPDDIIHIITDCDGKVLCFRWPKALQWFFGDDLVEKTAEHIELYSRHHQPKFPDQGRHAMNPYWCRKHPGFQQNARDKKSKARLGVFHFGCGGEIGKSDEKPMTKPDSKDEKLKPEVIRVREEMMREGVMPWITRAHKFVQGILDPELLAAQMAIMQHYEPELTRLTIEGDPFPLLAVLVNPLTTDHRDLSDLRNGMALMTTAGSFTEGDLCCRQVAVKMAFEAGTITAIRGAEMHHCTTEWQGENRYSIVHTCGQHLQRYAKIMDQEGGERPTKSMGERDGSEERVPYIVSEEETEDEEGGEEGEEGEEAVGRAQKFIELSATPSESEEESEEESYEELYEEPKEVEDENDYEGYEGEGEKEAAAVGTVQNPIELLASPSPVSRKRKRDS
ncbi:MAG: hypothetical protein Q9195_008829 [Heterodermia aff. obscurata]